MLVELNKLLKLLALLLHPQSILENYLLLPSFPLLLPFQVAILISTVNLKLLLDMKKQVVRRMTRNMVMKVMRVMRVMRVVMKKISNLTHQEVVIRPSLVLAMRSPWPWVIFCFIIIFHAFIIISS